MKHSNYSSLKEIIKALRDVYPDFPIPLVLVLIEVAQHDGVTPTQVEKMTGLSQASTSRHCRALTAMKTPKEKGLDLAYYSPDPNDFRSKLLYLNDKGKELIAKIEEAMNKRATL